MKLRLGKTLPKTQYSNLGQYCIMDGRMDESDKHF